MSAARKRVVERIQHDVFGRGDVALIPDVYAAPLVEGVTQLARHLRAGFPDLDIEIEHLLAEGDTVACRWSASGTHQGPFHNLPATGVRVRWSGISFYTFDAVAERIIAVRSTWDVFGLLRQLRAALR